MKLLAVIMAAITVVSFGAPAQAIVVNYSGSSVNMGHLTRGQSGTISDIMSPIPHHLYESMVSGGLPRLSAVTFHYTIPAFYLIGDLNGSISYNYYKNGSHRYGSSVGDSQTDVFFSTTSMVNNKGFINGVPAVSQVFATANLTTPGNGAATGTVQFANYTQSFETFTSKFIAAFDSLCDGHPLGTITYSVSSIPLPASLPVFVMALASLCGFGRRKHPNVQLG